MKAMVYREFGPLENLEYREVPKPSPRDSEVLVNIQAAAVNWLDWHFLTGTPLMVRLMAGLVKPKNIILGIDMAGIVEKAGRDVQEFSAGDEVFGTTDHGCFADYTCIPKDGLILKPVNLTFEEAAAVPGAAIPALQALRDHGKVQPGQKILINGASGGLGTFAVQIAKSMGAEVTGVCSTRNLDMVRSIGADYGIDYAKEDFTQNRGKYDLIFDAVAKRSFLDCIPVLKSQGIYITTAFSPVLALKGSWISIIGEKKMVPLPPKQPNHTDLVHLKKLLEKGDVKPVIDRTYPLSEIPNALRYLETGRARGKIVITT